MIDPTTGIAPNIWSSSMAHFKGDVAQSGPSIGPEMLDWTTKSDWQVLKPFWEIFGAMMWQNLSHHHLYAHIE